MPDILIVDDEDGVRFTLCEALEREGTTLHEARSGEEALDLLDGDVDVVVTDLSMPGMDGLELLRRVKSADPDLPVVIVTARGSERTAVEAMKAGAHDYLTKPFRVDELRLVIERALEVRGLRRSVRHHALERAIGRPVTGDSAAFRQLLQETGRVARHDVTVLLGGETGTGKELVAALVHALSPRCGQPFIRFNCAAIPAELAEAELFGHARGAFTGADKARSGFFQAAHGGTLFLDEVGDLPLAVQAKLLRALQESEVQPVGAGRTEKVDVRVVAATNKDLHAEARAGRFREDLVYRLAVVELRLPPLRERRDDIGPLASSFCRSLARRFGLPSADLSPALINALIAREWPGNVRELENVIARMLALSEDGRLDVHDLPASEVQAGAVASLSPDAPLRERVAAFERALLEEALQEADFNQSAAARKLGLTRATLFDKVKRYGLTSG